jgi:hypothetical protein
MVFPDQADQAWKPQTRTKELGATKARKLYFMSGFPAPKPTETNPPAPPKPDTVDESEEKVEETSVFDLRTYDRHWVDASSLQHFVQWIKIPDPKNPGRYIRWKKMLSDVPLILRDMGPPDVST